MLVFYTLQGADGEDPQHPNAFQIRGNGPITRSVVAKKLHFLNSGATNFHFHLRFKKAEGKNSGSYVWQDLDGDGKIPSYNGAVWLKILRVAGSAPASYSETKNSGSGRPRKKTSPAPRKEHKPKHRKPPPPKPPVTAPPPARASPGSMSPGPWGEVLAKKPAESTVDLGNIEDIRNQLPADFAEKSARVQSALVKRIRAKQEATELALLKLNLQKAKDQERQDNKDKVEKVVKNKVQSWHKDSTGQAKGLWTLLCNLNQALWQPNKWEEVDSSRMLEPKYVKRMFRRGIKIVHPDRLPAGATPEQEVAAERITQALQEAWSAYSKKNHM